MAEEEENEPPTEPMPPPPAVSNHARPAAPLPAPKSAFAKKRYRFSSGLRSGETARIRDEENNVLLTYRSFASVVGVVAALVAGIVLVAGLAAVAFLIAEQSAPRAVIAFALTLAFTFGILMLVPRIEVTLYEGDQPALTISQNFVFPTASYVVATIAGQQLATIRKSAFSRLGRTRWSIYADGRPMGHAVEESFSRAMTRKLLGKFDRRFDSNVKIEYSGFEAGCILRRGPDADTLDIRGDLLDPRVAVALATLVLGSEP